ncbi:MAG: hypothetical protein ACD_75C02623G0005 [uncultured bacterium]|nr:MAG: hypothetical protein ACD_75C02623G0005 [uncultured bacterium]
MPRPRPPKTIEQRLDSIEIMLATILDKINASPSATTDMKEFIAAGKARGLSMLEIINQWNAKKRGEL